MFKQHSLALLLKVLKRMSETNPTLNLLTNFANGSRTFEALSVSLQSACLPMFSTFLPIYVRAIRIVPSVRFQISLSRAIFLWIYSFLNTLGVINRQLFSQVVKNTT